ncbi:hypothetical protein GOODEAATRI_016606 [Goodea atripinnis]|uniref:Uncharacterized protein n=1 Tax=Goodea atripinnis TaxID=208336 RepID=A0ABV0NV67_9TELE
MLIGSLHIKKAISLSLKAQSFFLRRSETSSSRLCCSGKQQVKARSGEVGVGGLFFYLNLFIQKNKQKAKPDTLSLQGSLRVLRTESKCNSPEHQQKVNAVRVAHAFLLTVCRISSSLFSDEEGGELNSSSVSPDV